MVEVRLSCKCTRMLVHYVLIMLMPYKPWQALTSQSFSIVVQYGSPDCRHEISFHIGFRSCQTIMSYRKRQKLVRSLLVRTCCGQPIRTKNNYFGDADRDLRTAEINSRRQFSVTLPRNSRHVMRITHNCGLRKIITKLPADSLRIANTK